MKVIYRISDGGYNKRKPVYVTKRDCFLHFLNIFKDHDIYVVADNVSDETYTFLMSNIDSSKIMRTNLSNAGSFMFSVDYALKHFNNDEKVYFAEDDYVYTKDAPSVILEGLDVGEYSSGYDHPGQYINHSEGGPNPFISNGGEETRVLITKHKHWKLTNSLCMTFATTIKTIKEDLDIYRKYCSTNHPYDFRMFTELRTIKKRKLVSCIPGVSTHGETEWLSPFIDWESQI